MQLNELDKTFFGQVREAARIARASSKHRLVGELLKAHQTISEDSYIILKLEAALKEIEELSEGSPSSYRDFGDIARSALALMQDARGGKLHNAPAHRPAREEPKP
jgi:hypothetical protein